MLLVEKHPPKFVLLMFVQLHVFFFWILSFNFKTDEPLLVLALPHRSNWSFHTGQRLEELLSPYHPKTALWNKKISRELSK